VESRVNLGRKRLLLGLWISFGIQLLGQIVDVKWHAAHGSHFRSASEQVQAHWVTWLGIAVMLAVSTAAVRSGEAKTHRGFLVALVASGFLALAQAWNFWEHAHGRAAVPAHVVMVVSRLGILVATGLATHEVVGRDQPEAVRYFRSPKGR
jgi:hypothetical protein